MKKLFKTFLTIVIIFVNDMIEKNDIEVDAVSGATMSSEVIKAAVRDALRSDH